jgi:hypothetical protein
VPSFVVVPKLFEQSNVLPELRTADSDRTSAATKQTARPRRLGNASPPANIVPAIRHRQQTFTVENCSRRITGAIDNAHRPAPRATKWRHAIRDRRPSTKGTVKNVIALWTSNLKAVRSVTTHLLLFPIMHLVPTRSSTGEADIDISVEAGKTATLSKSGGAS